MADLDSRSEVEPRPQRKAARKCTRMIEKHIHREVMRDKIIKRKHSDVSSESESDSDSDYDENEDNEEDENEFDSELDSELEEESEEELEEESEESEEEEEESEEESEEDLEDADSELEEENEDMEEDLEDTRYQDDIELEEQQQQLLYLVTEGLKKHKGSPSKYNMKDESAIVNQFYQLITEETEENTIDTSITEFKSLSEEKQNELITALQNRPVVNTSIINLMLTILTMKVSPEIQASVLSKYKQLQMMDPSTNEYYKMRSWLDKVVSIPFGIYKEIPVTLADGPVRCGEFMDYAMKCMNDAVFGQDESKLQILQFIGTKIANPNSRGLSLLLIGPPGIGKTTIIKNGIAKALGWPFQFISLSGDSDASTYTGHQLVYESSHCGKIVNSLVASKSMSTIMMFDELDKISQTAKGEEVMNLLIHLTDPVQNMEFEDKYLSGIPIDLSKVMFVFSANDITKIDKVLLDRMIVIDLKGYDLQQKTVIAQDYLVPIALQDVNLEGQVTISKDMLTNVIQTYANEEKGVRELKRSIEQITQKVNMLRLYNSPTLPYHIKDFSLPFTVREDHVKLFIKKKVSMDTPPPFGMYL